MHNNISEDNTSHVKGNVYLKNRYVSYPGERNQKYLSSSEGNTYSTGPRTPTSSEHKPSAQIDGIENNNLASYPEIDIYQLNATGGTQRSSKI